MPQPRHTESSILQSYLLTPSPLPTILPYSSFLQLVPSQYRSHPSLKRLYRDLQFQRNIDIDTVRENIEHEVARGITLKANLRRRLVEEQRPTSLNNSTTGGSTSKKRKRPGNHPRNSSGGDSPSGSKFPTPGPDSDRDTNPPKTDLDDITNPIDAAIDTTYYTTTLHPSHTQPVTTTTTTSSSSHPHPLTAAAIAGTTPAPRSKYHTTTSLLTAMSTAVSDLDDEIAELDSETARLASEITEIVGALSDLRYGRFARPVSGGGSVGGDEGGEGSGGVVAATTLEEEIVEVLRELEKQARRGLAAAVAAD